MRIVLFHFYSKKPNPVYQEMAHSFEKKGHEVLMAEPTPNGDVNWVNKGDIIAKTKGPKPLTGFLAKVPVLSKWLLRWQYSFFLARVKQQLKAWQPDIVQVNPPLMAWLLPLFMPKDMHFILDIRQINEAVNDSLKARLSERFQVWGMRMNALFFFEKTCFCHMEAAKRILGERWQQRGGVVVPVGVDDLFNEFEYEETAVSPPPPTPKTKFIYIGTLSRLRNLEILLEAAKVLKKSTDAFQLDLVGPDTTNGYYPQVVKDLGIESVAAVKPPVPYESVPALLATYDVGLAYVPDRPTWHYQPTIKVLEYRALGLPIISTDVASHREVVEQRVNGILCGDTPEQLAAAMHEFIKEPEFLCKATKNARQMRRGNSWLDIAEKYIQNVYQEVSHR